MNDFTYRLAGSTGLRNPEPGWNRGGMDHRRANMAMVNLVALLNRAEREGLGALMSD